MEQLIYIRCNYSFAPESTLNLEEIFRNVPESIDIVEKYTRKCKHVRGEVGKTLMAKLQGVIEKTQVAKF